MGATQTSATQAAFPVEALPPFGVGDEPAQLSAAVPHLLQQTSKLVTDIDSSKTFDGSESQQGQQMVQPLQMNPRMTIARFEPLLEQLRNLCILCLPESIMKPPLSVMQGHA